jgi:predicted dehydrogenase
MPIQRRSFLLGQASAALLAAAPLRLPKKVRVAFVGTDGHTAEVTAAMPDLPDIEIAAIHDTPKRAPNFARRFPNAKVFTADYRTMLDEVKPDIVAVCNILSDHAAAILECVQRGIHVIAEKPIATEPADLERIKKALGSSKAKLTTMFPMRYSPPYLALKKIVASGELGEICQLDSQKSYKVGNREPWWYKRATYGGTMPWIGIHMVDLMRYCSGRDFVETFGFQNHMGFPETGDTENVTGHVFRMDNGGVALLRMDYLRPLTAPTHGDDRLRIAGTKGVAEYMAATGVTLLSLSRKQPEVIKELPPSEHLFVHFVDHIYNGKPAPITWDDIYRTTHIVLQARNAAEGHKIIKL